MVDKPNDMPSDLKQAAKRKQPWLAMILQDAVKVFTNQEKLRYVVSRI